MHFLIEHPAVFFSLLLVVALLLVKAIVGKW